MSKSTKIGELYEADQRCASWGKHSYDRGPDYPAVNTLYKAMREREGAGSRGRPVSNMSDDDAEIDLIVARLPPVNKMIIKSYYAEHGSIPTKARSCGMTVTEYNSRRDGALWVVWAWLQTGSYRKT